MSVIIVTLAKGEMQKRREHEFKSRCVMVGAGVKAISPFVETPTVIVKSAQEANIFFVKASQALTLPP